MIRPRRLLLLGLNYSPESTGVAPYAAGLARGMRRLGLQVEVISAHPHYPAWRIADGYGDWTRREVLCGVKVRRLRHFVPAQPRGWLRLLSEVSFGARLVFSRWGSTDAIVAVSPALFSSALALLKARVTHRRVPFVLWVQDLYTMGLQETAQGSRAVQAVMRLIEGSLLRRVDRVVVIHPRFAAAVSREFGVAANKIAVVRNWSHIVPVSSEDREAARVQFGWGENELIVLHAGNIGVKQGLETVVSAAALADDSGASVRFVLVGTGSERARLERSATGLGSITFLDSMDDEVFTAALDASDVLLVHEKPGVAEMAVPSKLTSYFAAGRPILAATDPEGISAGEVRAADAGLVVAPGDAEALLAGVLTLTEDPAEAKRLGSNGRRFREEMLSEEVAIASFMEQISSTGRRGRSTAG